VSAAHRFALRCARDDTGLHNEQLASRQNFRSLKLPQQTKTLPLRQGSGIGPSVYRLWPGGVPRRMQTVLAAKADNTMTLD
jgi:hypothetical protein